MNIKGNVMVAGLNAENRHLRDVIEKMKQEQAQGVFIEQLQCHAIAGLCSQPFVLEDGGVEKVIEISNRITNGVISQIMQAVRESQQAEAQTEELPPAEQVHPKSALTLDPTMPPPEERIEPETPKKRKK